MYHQLPRRCILMIQKDKCHIEVKKQCRKVSKILSLEPQPLFLIILYFWVLLFLTSLSRTLKTFCITPVLAKKRVGDTTTPLLLYLANSPVCSLSAGPGVFTPCHKACASHQTRHTLLIFPHSQKHMLKGTILNHSGYMQTTEIFHFFSHSTSRRLHKRE